MPSILFVMKYPLHRHDNLKAKFDGQMDAARALGWDAYCVGWDAQGMFLVGDGKQTLLRKNALAEIRGYDHTKIFADLMKAAGEALRRVPFDALYLRYMPTFSGALRAVSQLKRSGGKLIVEYPTYPIAQENDRFFFRRQVFRYADRVMERIHPMVDLYALIGEDCGGKLRGRPAINIVNGVRVENLPIHKPRAEARDVRLLALASMSGWHGYDRIISSLAAYGGDADVRIDFVGGGGDGSLAVWQALANERKLSDRITFHGPLYGDALEEIVSQCDLGVGSLGMFRYGLRRGMTLKAREFMARGLPFIAAVADPALPDDGRFFLQVPNDESPVDMAAAVSFAVKSKADEALPGAMRAYAEQNLSWKSVMARILERLNA
jgi:glycosyltransferase involved in cell wall biosynthesis